MILQHFALQMPVLLLSVALNELQRQITKRIGDPKDDAELQQIDVNSEHIYFPNTSKIEHLWPRYQMKFKLIRDRSQVTLVDLLQNPVLHKLLNIQELADLAQLKALLAWAASELRVRQHNRLGFLIVF